MTRHTDEEIDAAARRFDELAAALDPDSAPSDNIDELARIAAASATVREDE